MPTRNGVNWQSRSDIRLIPAMFAGAVKIRPHDSSAVVFTRK
jgi:hypothetical protein